MSKTNNFVFNALLVLAWIIFVGLCIEVGGLIVNFFFSIYKPDFIQNLYLKLDLTEMYTASKPVFFSMYGFILIVSILKAYLFYIVISLMHKMNLEKPFSSFVSGKISQIGFYALSIGLLTLIGSEIADKLMQRGFYTGNLTQYWTDGAAFILMGAVIYIIATIFKKGLALQTENDLTV